MLKSHRKKQAERRRKGFRPFQEARNFAHSLRLYSTSEWFAFCRGEWPPDIPVYPNEVYAGKGWKGFDNWLGTWRFAKDKAKTKVRVGFRPFHQARRFAQDLRLRNLKEWRSFCKGKLPGKGKRPPDIPAYPEAAYANKGWKGYGDWLGTGTIALQRRQYRPFRAARDFAQSLRLKSVTGWESFSRGVLPGKGKRPLDIPSSPHRTYANKGWKGYGDWLGTGTIAPFLRQFRPFREARDFAHGLRLRSKEEWSSFRKGALPGKGERPPDIPSTPEKTYANKGWKGYGDWLGTGTIAPFLRQFRPFREARDFAQSLRLKSRMEWKSFCRGKLPGKGRLPSDVPAAAQAVYAGKGWKGYGDWLGTRRRSRVLRPKSVALTDEQNA